QLVFSAEQTPRRSIDFRRDGLELHVERANDARRGIGLLMEVRALLAEVMRLGLQLVHVALQVGSFLANALELVALLADSCLATRLCLLLSECGHRAGEHRRADQEP